MAVMRLTARALRRLFQISCKRPLLTVFLSLGLAVLGIAYAAHTITFRTSTLSLLPRRQHYVSVYRNFTKDFGEPDDIVIAVQGRTVDESKAYAARLVHEIETGPIRFPRVAYRIDPQRFEGSALLYLSEDELREIRDKVFDHQDLVNAFAANPTLDRLIESINQEIAGALLSHFFDLGLRDSGASADLTFLRDLLAQISDRVGRHLPYRSPWGAFFPLGTADEDSGYFLSDDKSLLFILVEPASEAGSFTYDRAAIEEIRRRIAALSREFPEVRVGVTGTPTLYNDEMTAAFRDSEIATFLAFAFVLGLLLLGFRRVGKPIVMLGVLAVSLAWSIGVVALTIGHLTIFSVMFIPIVVGIGIDYGIYLLFRYEEEIFLGRSLQQALELTAVRSGPGILLGALTAVVTFGALVLTNFRGIQEFGFISATALLMAVLSMLTLFPALLVLVDRRSVNRPRGPIPHVGLQELIRVPLLERLAGYPKTVLVTAAAFTVFSVWTVRTVAFDYDLLNLQAKGTESVVWERKILATAKRSGSTALAAARSLPELERKHEAFERLSSVSQIDSVLRLIPDRQPEKIKIIQEVAPLVAPVRLGLPRSLDVDGLIASLETLKRRFDLIAAEAAGEGSDGEVKALRTQVGTLVEKLRGSEREVVQPRLNDFQSQLYRDFQEKFHTLQRNLSPRTVTIQDVPEALRRKFIGKSGRFLLQIHPKVDIWDRQGASRFVEELRSVDPDVTGTSIITYEAIHLMDKAYREGAAYAFVFVTVLAAFMIRRVREICLVIVPLILGPLWTVGLMHLFGLKFNLANVWGLPLIIGASAEYGVNVVVRYMEARAHGGPLLAKSTVMGVVFNGLTTIAGFGTLLIAHHQGIWSLGLLLTIGSCASLASSLVVLPVLIRLFGQTPSLE